MATLAIQRLSGSAGPSPAKVPCWWIVQAPPAVRRSSYQRTPALPAPSASTVWFTTIAWWVPRFRNWRRCMRRSVIASSPSAVAGWAMQSRPAGPQGMRESKGSVGRSVGFPKVEAEGSFHRTSSSRTRSRSVGTPGKASSSNWAKYAGVPAGGGGPSRSAGSSPKRGSPWRSNFTILASSPLSIRARSKAATPTPAKGTAGFSALNWFTVME